MYEANKDNGKLAINDVLINIIFSRLISLNMKFIIFKTQGSIVEMDPMKTENNADLDQTSTSTAINNQNMADIDRRLLRFI